MLQRKDTPFADALLKRSQAGKPLLPGESVWLSAGHIVVARALEFQAALGRQAERELTIRHERETAYIDASQR